MPSNSGTALLGALLLAAIPATAVPQSAPAQPVPAQPAPSGQTAPAPAPQQAVSPDSVAALQRMGAALRKLSSFSVRADTIREQVLESGQKLQRSGVLEIRARRPDHLRVDATWSQAQRTLYYDGTQATLFGKQTGYYATAPAPPTILELLDVLSERYGIELPLADLFVWGTEPNETQRLRSGMVVGFDQIDRRTCDHYAFQEQAVEWQVWIDRGAEPLPCRLVITSLTDPSRPQYMANFTWTPNQSFADAVFQFDPPANARRISFHTAEPAPAQ